MAIPIVGTIVTGKVVSNILDELEEKVRSILAKAEETGSALLYTAFNQLNVATQNASILLKDQQDILFENLARERQEIFRKINIIIDRVNAIIAGRLTRLSELTTLNIMSIDLPFVRETAFYISSINGITQIYRSTRSSFLIEIIGIGVGQNSDALRAELEVLVNGRALSQDSLSRGGNQLKIQIPFDVLSDLYSDNEIVTVPIALKSKVRQRRGFPPSWRRSQDFEINFKLILLPIYPLAIKRGNAKQTIATKKLDGRKQSAIQVVNVDGPCGNDRDDGPTKYVYKEIEVSTDHCIVAVETKCSSGEPSRCRFVYDVLDVPPIQANGTKAFFKKAVQACPLSLTFIAHYETYIDEFTENIINPNDDVRLKYNVPFEINLSPENKRGQFQFRITSIIGEDFIIDNESLRSSDGILTARVTEAGGYKKVILSVAPTLE